ncbi:MAG: hypothetical protein KDB90_14670 [Planctomycetes bacterium]|nr:hypothetical protein [Planctomycetota bacterium]
MNEKKDTRFAARSALIMMRDHAKARLKAYATRHRMRETGWHFMIDSSIVRGKDGDHVSESGLVLLRCTGPRYFCVRVTVDSNSLSTPEATTEMPILDVDAERVTHLIFSRDGWTQTKAIKKQSDKIVENAKPVGDEIDS